MIDGVCGQFDDFVQQVPNVPRVKSWELVKGRRGGGEGRELVGKVLYGT